MRDSILLLDIGVSAGELPNTTPAPVRYGCWFPVPHDATPVPSVTGLTATPVADGILLQWEALDLPDVVYVIERATAPSGPWIELARTTNTHYLVSDPSGDTWFFRVIPRVRGRAGSDSTVEGASKVIAGDEDLAELIEKQKEIDEARVLERVELIDINAESILEDILRSNEFNDMRRQHGDTLNRAVEDITLLIEDGQVTAQQVVDLFAQLADEVSTRQAQYQQVNTAIADETSARVTAVTALHTQFSTDLGDTNIALNARIDTAEANAESARASMQNTLAAQITTGDTAVSTALHTRANQVEADAASARASMQNTLVAQINTTQALLQSSINTKVTWNEASVIAQQQVQAFQNGTFATLQQSFNVVAGQHNTMYNQWSGVYSVTVTGSTHNGQPIIAGIKLAASSSGGSEFVVQSETFHVITQNASSGLELRNGFLRVFRGNAQRIIGNGFGTNNDLVDYFGPNVGPTSASKTNAVMWMDTSGNAAFNGTVSASNITGSFQSTVIVNWTGMVKLFTKSSNQSSGIQTVHTFTLSPPKLVGAEHLPYLVLNIILRDSTRGVNVWVDEQVNGSWQTIIERPRLYSLVSDGHERKPLLLEKSVMVTGFGSLTAGARTFRVRVRAEGFQKNRDNDVETDAYVTAVRGHVVGLR